MWQRYVEEAERLTKHGGVDVGTWDYLAFVLGDPYLARERLEVKARRDRRLQLRVQQLDERYRAVTVEVPGRRNKYWWLRRRLISR